MAFWPANILSTLSRVAKSGMIVRCSRRASVVLIMFLLYVHTDGFSPLHAETAPLREYQVKAAFLYTITKFVEWSALSSSVSSQTLNIAILGQDPFGDNLDVIKGKTVKGRSIAIRHVHQIEEIRDCDVVFISFSEKRRLTHILKQLQNLPVLTVADHEGFCEAGGMINLVNSKNRVVFEINVTAARRARLTISSQLLKLARIVVE